MDYIEEIVNVFTRRRKELGMSQLDVANKMGTTQSAISELESRTKDPRMTTVLRWASALDLMLEITIFEV